MAVHHIDMDPVGAGRVDRANLLAQPGEIGGEDGRGDADGLLHGSNPNIAASRAGKESAPTYPRLSAVRPSVKRAMKKPSAPPSASEAHAPGRIGAAPASIER